MLEVVPGKFRMPRARFLFLQPVHWSLPLLILFFIVSQFSHLTTSAQMGVPNGGSPLYNSRPYSPPEPSRLPKALDHVGIDQKLHEQLPLDLEFRNESGEAVKLGKYFGDKPLVLSLVFYECPMLCNQVLNGMVGAFRVMSFRPGKEFEVITVSFDSRETPTLAGAKKSTYVAYLPERADAASGWHFSDWR
jgi:protein SCO1